MVLRPHYLAAVRTALGRAPVAALLGPRQCGKTTLARTFVDREQATWLDLESPSDLARLQQPELFLAPLRGLVVIDEVQQRPELFALLRVLADRPGTPARFLLLGSASPDLVRGASETLAGRIEFVDMSGFDLAEVGSAATQMLWLRGGFPRAFLADTDDDSFAWRSNFIRTFLERDLPQLGLGPASPALPRLWAMLGHWHGQTLNSAALSRDLGISGHAVRACLDVLTGTYLVRQLPPWYASLAKRQVKAPKVYLRDSGLLHGLLALKGRDELFAHPRIGASWEGFCLEQILQTNRLREAYFWATHAGAEIDLVFPSGGKLYGVEVKWSERPAMTKSLHVALADLELEHVWLVYPGPHRFPLHEKVTALPALEIPKLAAEL